MAGRRPVLACGVAALAALAAACAGPGPDAEPAPAPGALRLSYEDVLLPSAYAREGPARVEPATAAAGFWAVAPGLPRPERGRVENVATGASLDVALFAGPAAGPIRLSAATAEALDIGGPTARVRITAVRREPRIAAP